MNWKFDFLTKVGCGRHDVSGKSNATSIWITT